MSLIPTSQKRPFIPAPGCVQIELIYTYLGQTCENVYHIQQGDGATEATQAEMQALLDLFNDQEAINLSFHANQARVLNLIRARQMGLQAGMVLEKVPTGAVAGKKTGQPMPGNVTAAVTWRTALSGRSYRGRTYLVGLDNTQVNGDQLAGSAQLDVQGAYGGLIANVHGAPGAQLVVISYAHNKFWRSTAVATVITSASVDPNLDSQRRRLTGRGK